MKITPAYIMLFGFLSLWGNGVLGQILSPDRRVDWEQAGLLHSFPDIKNVVDILDFGGDRDGQLANDEALQKAIDALNGKYGAILFPSGTYLFNETINLKDSTILKGEGADNTILQFDLGGKGHLINVEGLVTGRYDIAAGVEFGSNKVTVADQEQFKTGDFIRIYQNDEALVASDWAVRSTGQINQITGLSDEGGITLLNSLRMNYEMALNPVIEKISPVKGVVISCLKIERNDITSSQTSNIQFRYASGCLVQGIESNRCNFSHITMSYSHGIKVSGSYFHHGFSYGSGGKAYGVVAQFSTSNCLVENNIFERLRHAMLLQAGANGNVFAYNYSTDPFWEETLSPPDAAGDLVLHGNYPYANLFESNHVQNIAIDNSHKNSGPINTLLRNRAELYGLIMFPNPPTDRQNIIGNEIPNLDVSRGFFVTFGTDHLIHGNLHKDEIIPANTTSVEDTTYYLSKKPDFLGNYPWPSIGLPNEPNLNDIPAKVRFSKGEMLALCGSEIPIVTGAGEPQSKAQPYRIYPNPSQGTFILDLRKQQPSPVLIEVVDILGNVLHTVKSNRKLNKITLLNQPAGLYFVKIYDGGRQTKSLKIIVD